MKGVLTKKQIPNCTQRTRARRARRRVQARICLLLRPLLPRRAFLKEILSYPNFGLCLGIVKAMWKSSQTDVRLLNNRLPNYYLWYLWWLLIQSVIFDWSEVPSRCLQEKQYCNVFHNFCAHSCLTFFKFLPAFFFQMPACTKNDDKTYILWWQHPSQGCQKK